MKRLVLAIILIPGLVLAGTLTIYQNSGGNIGSVVMTPAAQIFYDASSYSQWLEGTAYLNWSHTIGAGTNRMLVVGCVTGGAPETISSMTVGGFSMTLSTSNYDATGGLLRTYIFTYADPPLGVQGITAYTTTGVSNRAMCGGVSFRNVNTISPVDIATGTIRSPSAGVQMSTFTTNQIQDVIIDVVGQADNGFLIADAGQGSLFTSDPDSLYYSIGMSTRTAPLAGTYAMGWTTSSNAHLQTMVAIKPAP